MKTLKKIGIYFLRIGEVLVLDVALLVCAIVAPRKLEYAIIEGVEEGKKIKKAKKAKKK